MRTIFPFFLVPFVLACNSCASGPYFPTVADTTPLPVIDEQYERAAMVETTCMDGSGAWGSAVLLDDHRALTALHVVAQCGDPIILVQTSDGKKHLVTVDAIAPNADMVRLVALDRWAVPKGKLQWSKAPHRGRVACAVTGMPHRNRLCGEVQESNDDAGAEVEFRIVADHGNSGSAVYDSAGRLVGVLTQLRSCSNGQYCSTLASEIDGREWILR